MRYFELFLSNNSAMIVHNIPTKQRHACCRFASLIIIRVFIVTNEVIFIILLRLPKREALFEIVYVIFYLYMSLLSSNTSVFVIFLRVIVIVK